MEALSAADLLDVWEAGSSAEPLDRALILLGRARPDLPPAELGALPIGRRDLELIRLRRATFGERMTGVAECPACGERLELDFDGADLVPEADEVPSGPIRVVADGREVTIRPPTTDDLIAALHSPGAGMTDATTVRRVLLARLIVGDVRGDAAERPGSGTAAYVAVLDGGGAVVEAIGEAILQADPAAAIDLAADCPACGQTWTSTLDIGAYLWTEVVDAARRVAGEVAELAAAFGWREADVLRLTPWRRRLYLELATG